VPASSSDKPKRADSGPRAPVRIARAVSATALSTQPPVIDSSTCPSAVTYIRAPMSNGAEPSTAMRTLAATRRLARSQFATVAAVWVASVAGIGVSRGGPGARETP
jgi:hypothetical protein